MKNRSKENLQNVSFNNKKIFQNEDSDIYSIDSQTSTIDLQNSLNHCELIDKYIYLNNQALDLQAKGQHLKALSIIEKASLISQELKDDFKRNESDCNKGIIYFHLNNIKNAINLLQHSFDYFYKLCNEGNSNNDIKNLTLLCKSGANLCLCKMLLFDDKEKCTEIINDIINIISQEEDLNNQIFCIKYLNNILFNVNSLLFIDNISLSNYLNDININQSNNSSEEINEEMNKINQLYIESFYNFVATQEIDPWINALNIIYQKTNEFGQNSAVINILFNQQIAIILKYMENNEEINNQELNEAKLKLSSLMKSLSQINYNNEIKNDYINDIGNETALDEEEINNIIGDYKYKLSIIREIYEILKDFENQVENKLTKQPGKNQDYNIINIDYFNKNIKNQYYNDYEENFHMNINSEFFLILLLRYTKTYFENNIDDPNLKNNLINDIERALDAVNNSPNSGLDFSNINFFSLEPELSNHLINIFRRLFHIYRRSILRQVFDVFKSLKSDSIKPLKSSNKVKNKRGNTLEDFFEYAYQHIYDGEKITKINFRNNGIKEHYFQVENKIDHLQYYIGKNLDKLKKEFDFKDILKIKIGFETKNVKAKLNNIKINKEIKTKPYMFLSFILENDYSGKTLDLVFNNERSARKWFYGLHFYFQISNRPYKICSCSNYLLFRVKSKMINKLKSDINKIKTKSFAYYIKKYFNF